MSDLLVIVPSRGRPAAAAELAEAFSDTCTAETELVFAVDRSDPTGAAYRDAVGPSRVWQNESSTMVEALNDAAACAVQLGLATHLTIDPYPRNLRRMDGRTESLPFAIGFMGDDHRPRTKGWDAAYVEALRDLGTGIVYGNDLLQGGRLPTQVAMTSDIVRALGYMAPPELTHLFVDNFWLDLGAQAGCIRYLPDVVVEHMHPVAQKAAWDEGHLRVNDASMYHTDRIAYTRFKAERKLAQAVAEVRTLRGAA
jgi:hypothetical protein